MIIFGFHVGLFVGMFRYILIMVVVCEYGFSQVSSFMADGRIAISSDGNSHKLDDWATTAFTLAFINAAELNDGFVHYDYNNHLGSSHKMWENYMVEVIQGGSKRFELDTSRFFNNQIDTRKSVHNFNHESLKSTNDDPLWFICAAQMQMVYKMTIKFPQKHSKFINAISHSQWNDNIQNSVSKKTWHDTNSDFPELIYNENRQRLYNRDYLQEVDKFYQWNSNTKEHFDSSEEGMTYRLFSNGLKKGGNRIRWKEEKLLFDNGTLNQRFIQSSEDILIIEAESTNSTLGNWVLIDKDDKHYIEGASQQTFLEFLGNQPAQGPPNSPLDYHFKVKNDGKYRLLIMTSKRLEGKRGDVCNDAWVKFNGPFESATDLPLSDLKNYMKFFQKGSTKTPERSWQWAISAEKGRHEFHELTYELRKGQDYKLTIAGRSKRFSMDFIIFYNTEKMSRQEAEKWTENLISKTD